ncbi:MAG: GrpB family protein [Hyphomicrobiaceae bacterium]
MATIPPMSNETRLKLVDPEFAHVQAGHLYEQTRAWLQTVLPTADVRHIGATAIPGCLTKGDLDIVIRVSPESFAQAETVLSSRFARNQGSVRTADFAAFVDTATDPPLGIQLTAINGPFDFFHAFVDALCASPHLVREYNALKSAYEGHAMAVYRAAKDAFIDRVLADRRLPR